MKRTQTALAGSTLYTAIEFHTTMGKRSISRVLLVQQQLSGE
ncbi:Uncharacterized protein APZ42_033727 [Daphnia magna]|uniref:Uncharacterized protein n=1 Tax=Daphnia magna TaxID=35525 RepID=A0A164KU19_9CRUS|nr:Uncharacterized protein APZ42_033727 [Daphnia magna]